MSRFSVPVVRIHPGAVTKVQVVLDETITIGTHFFERRVLCCGEACPACPYDANREFQYALVREETQQRVSLLEVPYLSWLGAKTLLSGRARIRAGSHLRLTRKHKRGPVSIELGSFVPCSPLNPELTLARAVAGLFGLGIPSREISTKSMLEGSVDRLRWKVCSAMRKVGLDVKVADWAHGNGAGYEQL